MTLFRRLVVSAVVVATAAVSLAAVAATPAAAADGTMTFDGRGWGHGRGMSQYGAQGYAKNYGWSSARILDHYYGNTWGANHSAAASRPVDPEYVRIQLMRLNAKPIRATINTGSLTMAHAGSLRIPAQMKTVYLNPIGTGSQADPVRYEVWASGSESCSAGLTRIGDTGSQIVTIGKAGASDSGGQNQLIRICPPTGSESIWYPGSIRGHIASNTSYAVNITTIEKELLGVVGNESIPSWTGAALEAQAIASRSYVLSAVRNSFADTCDTTTCQVYRGWYSNSAKPSRYASSDGAVQRTAGQVRLFKSNNRIARTEYSSTSGGWTAGPEMLSPFPAVDDSLGDIISPFHAWRTTVSVSPLEDAYGWKDKTKGSLLSIDVTKRNGLGVGGGRVVEAVLRFSNGVTKTTSGDDIRSRLKLRSNWFFPSCGSTQVSYLHATFQLFVQRDPNANESQDWCGRVGSAGGRQQLTHALSLTDEWAGVQVRALYDKILNRTLDSKGYAYWMDQVRRGVQIEQIAAYFYGGEEYFSRAGGTNAKFLDRLYLDLLGRSSDSKGRAYWLPLLDSRRITRTDAATNFYASIESRTSRVQGLYRQILGRKADGSGLDYWTEQLLRSGDIALSSYLAASDEYYKRVT